MLIHCPECGHQVSDKAVSCPACGYPMKPQAARRNRSKRRLPNGFGSITYLKGKRLHKPYLARVTVGKTDTGKPITRNLKPEAYYKTYNEAYAALIEFNRNPYTAFYGLFWKRGSHRQLQECDGTRSQTL